MNRTASLFLVFLVFAFALPLEFGPSQPLTDIRLVNTSSLQISGTIWRSHAALLWPSASRLPTLAYVYSLGSAQKVYVKFLVDFYTKGFWQTGVGLSPLAASRHVTRTLGTPNVAAGVADYAVVAGTKNVGSQDSGPPAGRDADGDGFITVVSVGRTSYSCGTYCTRYPATFSFTTWRIGNRTTLGVVETYGTNWQAPSGHTLNANTQSGTETVGCSVFSPSGTTLIYCIAAYPGRYLYNPTTGSSYYRTEYRHFMFRINPFANSILSNTLVVGRSTVYCSSPTQLVLGRVLAATSAEARSASSVAAYLYCSNYLYYDSDWNLSPGSLSLTRTSAASNGLASQSGELVNIEEDGPVGYLGSVASGNTPYLRFAINTLTESDYS